MRSLTTQSIFRNGRARQALPAGSAEAEAPDRLGLLRPHPVGARRVRLLGLRGRLAGRAAAELELPRRGRRRDRRRHVPALELRAGEPLRPGRVRVRAGRHPHPHPRRRAGRALRGDRGRRRLRDLRARRRRDRAGQLQLDRARRPRRAGRVPGRRHARQRRRRAVRLPHPAPQRHAEAGVEPRPRRRPTTTPPTGSSVPDNDAFENGFKTQWEQFLRHVLEDAPHEFDFLAGARGVRLAEAGLRELPHRRAGRPARARRPRARRGECAR